MTWIKRNLIFVIGAVAAAALLGFAGFYNFRGWQHDAEEEKNLYDQYEELKRLNNQNPHPGFGKVDNVKAAREQQKEIRRVLALAARYFQPPAAIPATATVTSSEFTAALRQTVDQLTREAARASVLLPPDYKFSFSQQFLLLNFAPGSLEALAAQLGEVKALGDVLIKAKVNHLDGIQRARVSTDDDTGPQTDYVYRGDLQSKTNELAVLTPYEITFRSFSPEIAQVLAGFANSPHGIIVQTINVEPAPASASDQPVAAAAVPYYAPRPVAPAYQPSRRDREAEEAAEARAMRPDLFGPNATRMAPPQAYAPPATTYAPPAAARSGSQTVPSEKQLRVTLRIQMVKLLPTR